MRELLMIGAAILAGIVAFGLIYWRSGGDCIP
jgi:nitrogen fixation-related uncharacterized protein